MSGLAKNIKNISFSQLLLLIGVFWLVVQVSLIQEYGIVTSREAVKYFDECHQLIQTGHFSDKKYLFYAVYILLHVVFYILGFETVGVFLFQLFLNLLATCLFFKLTYNITGKKPTAFIAVMLLLLTQTFQMWTVYLYTESVFSSLFIIFSYYLLGVKIQNNKNRILAGGLFLLLIFARPTGLLLIPVLFLYYFFLLIQGKEYLKAFFFSGFVAISFIPILNYAMQSSTTFNFVKPFLERQVICDVPETVYTIPSHTTSNTLSGIFDFIVHNKTQFIQLATHRFVSFWGLQRTFNSRSHNLYLGCFFYPIYLMGLIGLIKLFKQCIGVFIFIVSVLFFFTLSVELTSPIGDEF